MMATWTGWPPRSTLTIYSRGEELPLSYDPPGVIDLSDTIMSFWPHWQRTVELRLSTVSPKWKRWDERTLALMEENIRYDLGHDALRVVIKRMSGQGRPCSVQMCWKLIVRPV